MMKYARLLENRNLQRWYDNLERGSFVTARNYLRKLGHFCETNNTAPAKLLGLSDRVIYGLLLDNVSAMERRGAAGSHVKSVLKAVKSWLAFNDRELRRKIIIKGADETPTLRDERVPTQEELKRIFIAGDLKTRAACALIAHSGLRLEVLGTYDGADGLRLSDLPELEVQPKGVVFSRVPAMIRVRASLSKTGREYFTFLSDEGCAYLEAYLRLRIRNHETLQPDSPLISPKVPKRPFIVTPGISKLIRDALRRAGFPWRPYVLRSYFATQMMLAESHGIVIRDWRTFFMGHKGDIEAVYTLHKRRLPPEVIEQMRESYAKAQKYVQTVEAEKREDVTKAFKRQLLLVAGFKPEEIKDGQLELDDEQFQKLVRERLVSEVKNNGARQKVVALADVEPHLAEGWEFVSTLPNGKAVLRLPHVA